MRARRGLARWAGGIGIAAALVTGGIADAADPQAVARIATYQGADRQAVLEAGARKEGAVVISTVGTQIAPYFSCVPHLP